MTKSPVNSILINDIGFRLILIPFLGIAIPLLTGLPQHANLNAWTFKLSYLYTIGLTLLVWEGNRYLLFTLRNYFDWFDQPMKKILALLLVIPFFTVPMSVLLLVGWYHLFVGGQIDWGHIRTMTLVIMICILFIVHVYETVFLVKEAESEKLRAVQLERARAEAELEALRNQIDPHFIFNSLNTLDHFIDEAPMKAKQFNRYLAEVYRYLLSNRDQNLILLREEMSFAENYFALLKIRYGQAIELESSLEDSWLDSYLIPPISIQVLIENAVKHNNFSDRYPLNIRLFSKDDFLYVANDHRQLKKSMVDSSGLGLQNLNERYKLILEREIQIETNSQQFKVGLPVYKIM